MIKHLMRIGIGFTARKKRRINKMIKRNRHKTSKISIKKKKNNRCKLGKASIIKAIRSKNKDMAKGMRATCYNSNYG
jgi:23S rRNA A1618 N6-methylase RlmF